MTPQKQPYTLKQPILTFPKTGSCQNIVDFVNLHDDRSRIIRSSVIASLALVH